MVAGLRVQPCSIPLRGFLLLAESGNSSDCALFSNTLFLLRELPAWDIE
jgi:hypothetical protein